MLRPTGVDIFNFVTNQKGELRPKSRVNEQIKMRGEIQRSYLNVTITGDVNRWQ